MRMNDKAVLGQGLRSGFFDQEAFVKKRNLTLVLKTGIAGMQYHVDTRSEEGAALLDRLTPGTELMLYRDPDNEHDEWAISVYTDDDVELGYVTRFKNETIARLMDLGRRFVAVVDEPPELPDNPDQYRRRVAPTKRFDIPFSVYMEE